MPTLPSSLALLLLCPPEETQALQRRQYLNVAEVEVEFPGAIQPRARRSEPRLQKKDCDSSMVMGV